MSQSSGDESNPVCMTPLFDTGTGYQSEVAKIENFQIEMKWSVNVILFYRSVL